MKKLLSFVLSSLVIGNVIAWSMGAWPIDFELVPYTAQEQTTLADLNAELKDNPDDVALLVELGSIYSLHNDLDKASNILDKAFAQSPTEPQVLAWYSANNSKISGAMLDFSFGMYKLHTLAEACEGLSAAVEAAPNDLTIRLLRLATFANIGKINSGFEQVFDDEKWFETALNRVNNGIPGQVKSQFYLSMAQAYLTQAQSYSAQKLEQYLSLYQAMPATQQQDKGQFKTIEANFASLGRGHSWK
jgi:tetratricopeptide (TPR) repeat protein